MTHQAPAESEQPSLHSGVVLCAADEKGLEQALRDTIAGAGVGAPAPLSSSPTCVRIGIGYTGAHDLVWKADQALNALATDSPQRWRHLNRNGVYLWRGSSPIIAFLYSGNGTQYPEMLSGLTKEAVVRETLNEAESVIAPLLGRSLMECAFASTAREQSSIDSLEISQPAILTVEIALTRLLAQYGVNPDMVIGHSLGEFGALVAAGVLSFPSAIKVVSSRSQEMQGLDVEDPGAMIAVRASADDVNRVICDVDGYLCLANINSTREVVVGGATGAVDEAFDALKAEGFPAVRLPLHAFHTKLAEPVIKPMRNSLRRLEINNPVIPIVSNVTGRFYPQGSGSEAVADLISRQLASPVQFVRGLRTLYAAGARVFVEVGPRDTLCSFVKDVLGNAPEPVMAIPANIPKLGALESFNNALYGLQTTGNAPRNGHLRSVSLCRPG